MDLLSHVPYLSDNKETKDFDRKAGHNWIYPKNLPFRKYQFDITETAVFHNTLVCLPTGLGRTFIAAVVMYNYFRWYPRGIIVFLATQPLLAQQIDACHSIMGIPMSHMIELKGQAKDGRISGWHESRVIFTTPYIFHHGLEHSIVPTDLIKCIVVDEAHKAIGENPYTQSIQMLHDANPHFRLLALSAIPWSSKTTPEVIKSLHHITKLEIRSDKSPDVIPFTHKQKLEIIDDNFGKHLSKFKERCEKIMARRMKFLRENHFPEISLATVSMALFDRVRNELKDDRQKSIIVRNLWILLTLNDAYISLTSHGLRAFLQRYDNHPSQWCLTNESEFQRLLQDIREYLDRFSDHGEFMNAIVPNESKNLVFDHGKFAMLKMILIKHFEKAGKNENTTRAIVFADDKDIANKIFVSLLQCLPSIRPQVLMSRFDCTEQQQMEALENFKSNEANVLISTIFKGYDISEADLIVCFDKLNCSPKSLDQLIGRTGKSRDGQVIFFVSDDEERQNLEKLLAQRDLLRYEGRYSKKRFSSALQLGPRMIPGDIDPKVLKIHMNVVAESPEGKRKRSELSLISTVPYDEIVVYDESPPAKKANEQSEPVEVVDLCRSSSSSPVSSVRGSVSNLQGDLSDSESRNENSNLLEEEAQPSFKIGESRGSSDRNKPRNIFQNSPLRVNKNLLSAILMHLKHDASKTCGDNIPESHPNHIPGVSQPEPINGEPRLQDHLRILYKTPKNSDTIIIVEGRHFYVHKLILETRSPVFAAIFEREKESLTNEIVIDDMKPEVMGKILQFMYTDTIEDYEEMAGELLIAAHRFSLEHLTVSCEQVLCSKLNISNAVGTFIIADRCNSKSLKNRVTDFIREHLSEILNTPDYEELEKSRPELACHLIRVILSQKNEK